MTLYCAYVGGKGSDADALTQWMGEPLDGFLAYTAGWQGWNGLLPEVSIGGAALGTGGRRLTWSIMMIPDGDANQSVEYYREVARGDRNALFDQIGRQLIVYHNSIGDTAPIYVRSTWEVPGEWFPWNQAAVADPAAFRGAWAQFATALRAGRPQIKTVWDFNSDRGPVEYLYPGDQYVDVISQDIYWIHDLQGTDPDAAWNRSWNYSENGGYDRGLRWHFDWCKGKRKPMAISEFGIKLNDRPFQLNSTRWMQNFMGFVDQVNADPDVGMAYVNWWTKADANVGEFLTDAGEPHLTNVRNIWRARLPGTPLGSTSQPTNPTPAPDSSFPAVSTTQGTGADSLVLKISQDPYLGSAQYRVLIDGAQVGATFTASATRASGLSDTLTVKGDFSTGQHTAAVEFLNDEYGGTAATDRNLYLNSATFNSVDIPAAKKDILGSNETAMFTFTKLGQTLPSPDPTPDPAPEPVSSKALTLFTRTRTPLISGRRPLARAPGNIAAPAIVTPPSGLVWDIFTAENGQKLQWPLSNNQFDAIGFTLDGEQRDWNLTLNNAQHRFSGIRYYYAWQNILMGAFPQWQPAFRRVWRVYRKGNSGQALRTLVFECEQNSLTIPAGNTVWFFMGGTNYEGEIVPSSTQNLGINGFSLPLKQKMTVTGGAGSTGSSNDRSLFHSTVEVTFGQDLPAVDWSSPTWKPQDWADPEPLLWLVHHSFYGNAATKQHRYPYSWHFDLLKQEVVGNSGHVVLGGLQGIPTWRCWTTLANMLDVGLVMELYKLEQEALADTFGATDPRLVACELENEPVESWTHTDGRLGFRDSLLNYMYPIARTAWGADRTLIVKGTSFGSTDALRDNFDIDNNSVWGGANNILASHNYYGQAKRQNQSMIWWGSSDDCAEMAGWIKDKVGSLHFKGGGMTEMGANRWEFGDPNAGPRAEQEQGRMVGRMHTALHAKGLFVAYWDLVGDGNGISWLYRDVPGAEGHVVQAISPDARPFAGRAGRTV